MGFFKLILIKKMKTSFFSFLLIILIIKCEEKKNGSLEEKQLEERIKMILKSENLDKENTINKSQFEKIFRKLFDEGKEEVEKKEEKKILEGEEQKMFNLLLNQVVALLLKEVPDTIEVDKIKDYLKQEKIQEIFGKVLSNTNLQEFEKNMKNEEKKKKEEKTSDL